MHFPTITLFPTFLLDVTSRGRRITATVRAAVRARPRPCRVRAGVDVLFKSFASRDEAEQASPFLRNFLVDTIKDEDEDTLKRCKDSEKD